jgi:hypothetical protein
VVAAGGPYHHHPQGARHRRLQLRWCPLPDLATSTPRGPAIDIFNFGGGRCRTLPLAPPRGPPSTFSTSVVTAAGPCHQHPQGARHRRLQLRWWLLSDLTVSTLQGARHRRLQFRWWSLPDLAPSTPRGPPSMYSTSVVAAVGPYRQHPPEGPSSMSSTSVVAAARPAASTP